MREAWVYRLAAVVVKLARTLRPGATMDAFCDARHSRLEKSCFQFSYSNSSGNKIYIAKQQKSLDQKFIRGTIAPVLGAFTGIGTYPPKPPPLVELQRNPSGLRFFLCCRCGDAAYYRKTAEDAVFSINRSCLEAEFPEQGSAAGNKRLRGGHAVCVAAPSPRQQHGQNRVLQCESRQGALVYSMRSKFMQQYFCRNHFRSHLPLARGSCAESIPDYNLYAAFAEPAVCAIAGLLTAVKAGVAAAVIDLASLRNQDAFFNERISRGSEQ